MKAIQDVLMKNDTLEKAQKEIVIELKNEPILTEFIEAYQLSDGEILRAALELQSYVHDRKKQEQGKNLAENNNLVGALQIDENRKITFVYQYTKEHQELIQLREYIECFYMDEQMLKANISDFQNEAVTDDLIKVTQMVANLRHQKLPKRGFYLAGDNGVGKTHMLLALAKEFYRQEVKSIVVFFPELIRALKQAPYEAPAIIKKLQRTPVLMIDDIGSEMQTSYSRDEILLPILNARMNDKKLTYFTSNLDTNSLLHHFSQTQYGENEPIKAKRVMERIESLSEPITIVGKNKRRQ